MRLAFTALRLLPRSLRHRAIRSYITVDDEGVRDVEVKIADSRAEILAAARLVHDCYAARGLIEPHPSGVRITPHQVLPETVTFVAKKDGAVVGTMSLLVDAALGLAMEKIYRPELDWLRSQGRKLAEVGALCITPSHRRTGVSFLLNKMMWRTAQEVLDVDDLVIAVHPSAAELYEAALLFRPMGEVRHYPGLNDAALAMMMRLDLKTAREDYREAWGHLKKVSSNPYYMYVEREDPQIRMPTSQGFVWETWPTRYAAMLELLRARLDVLESLPPEFASLRQMVYARGASKPAPFPTPITPPPGTRYDVREEASNPWARPWLTTAEWVISNL